MTPCCAIGIFSWFLIIGLLVLCGIVFTAKGGGKLAALFPLIFVAVGAGGVWWGIKNWGKSPERMAAERPGTIAPPLPLPAIKTENGKYLPVRLKPGTPRGAETAAIGCFSIFWNTIVGVFVFNIFKSANLHGLSWFPMLFMVPFVLVGLGTLFVFLRALIRNMTVPETCVEISTEPLCPGETAKVRIMQAGRLSLANITVELVCEERISYTRGTDTYREQNVIFTKPLVNVTDIEVTSTQGWETTVDIAIPEGAMHSFHATHNDLVYEIRVTGVVRKLPDFKTAFPFRVVPLHSRGLLR
jgi:hypothetical protein